MLFIVSLFDFPSVTYLTMKSIFILTLSFCLAPPILSNDGLDEKKEEIERGERLPMDDEEIESYEQVDLLLTFSDNAPAHDREMESFVKQAIDIVRDAYIELKHPEFRFGGAETSKAALVRYYSKNLLRDLIRLHDLVGYNYEPQIIRCTSEKMAKNIAEVKRRTGKTLPQLRVFLRYLAFIMEDVAGKFKHSYKTEIQKKSLDEKFYERLIMMMDDNMS